MTSARQKSSCLWELTGKQLLLFRQCACLFSKQKKVFKGEFATTAVFLMVTCVHPSGNAKYGTSCLKFKHIYRKKRVLFQLFRNCGLQHFFERDLQEV